MSVNKEAAALHESGHATVALYFNYQIDHLSIDGFGGGFAGLGRQYVRPQHECLLSLAGCIAERRHGYPEAYPSDDDARRVQDAMEACGLSWYTRQHHVNLARRANEILGQNQRTLLFLSALLYRVTVVSTHRLRQLAHDPTTPLFQYRHLYQAPDPKVAELLKQYEHEGQRQYLQQKLAALGQRQPDALDRKINSAIDRAVPKSSPRRTPGVCIA